VLVEVEDVVMVERVKDDEDMREEEAVLTLDVEGWIEDGENLVEEEEERLVEEDEDCTVEEDVFCTLDVEGWIEDEENPVEEEDCRLDVEEEIEDEVVCTLDVEGRIEEEEGMTLVDVDTDVVVPGWEKESTRLEDEDSELEDNLIALLEVLEVLELRVEDGSVDELD
jgi:hypothetical protein